MPNETATNAAARHGLETENIPPALRELPQWVGWKIIERGGRKTKCPVDPKSGGMADSTDPSTWGTFEQAMATYRYDSLAGVGFVFAPGGGYCGVDVDDGIDPATWQLKPWAREIAEKLNSYAEVSPSGRGVKIFLRASKPGTRCRKAYQDGEIEIYDSGRFFTLKGWRLDGPSPQVEDRQAEVDELYAAVFGPAKPAPKPAASAPDANAPRLSDEEIIERASRNRKSGQKFFALWAGRWDEHFNSASEADSSVVFTLAFYTKDAAQIDRMFRTSGLMRPKWDEKHGAQNYGQMTIAKALAQVTGHYQPRRSKPIPSESAAPVGGGDGHGDEGPVPLGTRDPQTGRLVLSPRQTLPTAEAFIDEFHHHREGRTLYSYAGTLLTWRGNRFVEIEEESLCQRLQPWLHGALRYVFNKQAGVLELISFESNSGTIKAAVESIRAYAHLPASVTPPAWLAGGQMRPDPRELLPCPSGNLLIPSGKMLLPTPALFNINALDFDYDANAEAPERWIKFLEQLWGDDLESVELLQEWMGYCLVADTSQQKMLLLVGPRRSGKGTIGRVLTRLVGAGNVVGPTTSSLAGSFGLQPLIGKSLAIVSDARFTGENVGVVAERLLCISGEDTLTVDRKFLGSVTMKLPTRFMFLTNELPRMNDASGALVGRFIILRLKQSFYGREDVELTTKLMSELPGILLWAIEGLKRLRVRGHFVQPKAVSEAVREMEDLASPVLAFVRDRCIMAPGYRACVDDLYNAWRRWCERDGRTAVTNRQTFGRDLAAAVPGVSRRRGAGDVPFYEGISLKGGAP
jgi:putative DNA primase/helicase